MNLQSISKSLNREIEYTLKFRVPYVRINARWILTESFDHKGLEINDLETYTWREFKEEEIKTLNISLHNRRY